MAEPNGPRREDEALMEAFDQLVRLSAPPTPPISDLEVRVGARQDRRRRNRRRLALAGFAAVVALAAAGIALAARPDQGAQDRKDRVGTKPPGSTTTTLAVDRNATPVFTVGRVPDALSFESCDVAPSSAATIGSASCRYDNPATLVPDGLSITNRLGLATPTVRSAWRSGDAYAFARATGGAEDLNAVRFRRLGGRRVVDLAPQGRPSTSGQGAYRLLVGSQVVDLNVGNVADADLAQVASTLAMAPPSLIVSQALDALPDGSRAIVQGHRPQRLDADPLKAGSGRPFGTDTLGTEIAVPGSDHFLGVSVTSGVDVDAVFDSLLADAQPGVTETRLAGRRSVVIAGDALSPKPLPPPRPGPQVLVRLDDRTLVRVVDPGGSAANVLAIARAFR